MMNMNIDTNYLIRQMQPGLHDDEIKKIINDYLASLGIDSQDEIDEVTEALFPDIEAKISELKASLTELQGTILKIDRNDTEGRTKGKELIDGLEDQIKELEELSDAAHSSLDEVGQYIFDGSKPVVYNASDFNEDGTGTYYIDVNNSETGDDYLAGLSTSTDEASSNDDPYKNFDDKLTSDPDVLTNKTMIRLDFSDLAGEAEAGYPLSYISSWDPTNGRLVIKTQISATAFKLTEIRNYNPKTCAIAINGSFISDLNDDHWRDVVPDEITQSIYPVAVATDDQSVNLYDTLHYGNVPIADRLKEAEGYSDVVNHAVDTWNSLDDLAKNSGVPADKFAEITKEVADQLYLLIDDPSLIGTEKGEEILAEAMKVLDESGYSGATLANLKAMLMLHFIKYDAAIVDDMLGETELMNMMTELSAAVDAEGHHLPLAIAAYIVANDKLEMGLPLDGDTIKDLFTKSETVDGVTTDNTDWENLKACMIATQNTYQSMGLGANSTVDGLVAEGSEHTAKVEADQKVAESIVKATSKDKASDGTNIIDYGLNELANYIKENSMEWEYVNDGDILKYMEIIRYLFDDGWTLEDAINHPLQAVSNPAGHQPFATWTRENIMANFIKVLQIAWESDDPDMKKFVAAIMNENKSGLLDGLNYRDESLDWDRTPVEDFEKDEYKWVDEWTAKPTSDNPTV
ncbi:hypothetical protein K1X76_03220 [bacterium]|nr:hypothetical protein [bacterium]